MAPTPDLAVNDDLSTLAWVADEVRRSLELAHAALHRYVKEMAAGGGADLAHVDPSVLRQARNQIHQSVGALELVGLGPAAQPLRAAEAAVHRMSARPALITPEAVKTIERCSFALLDYLSRRLAGKAVSPLSMFPQYRAVQELAGAARAHPADLWAHEWEWRSAPPALEAEVAPQASDAAAIGQFEIEMLAAMRGRPGAAQRLCGLCDALSAGTQGHLGSLWQLAAAFFEAQADGLLGFDLHAKRVASRLLAQLRAGPLGQPSDRLAQDLLFFCAQVAPSDDRPAGPRLDAVRSVYGLVDEAPVDYLASSLGQFDPMVVTQARKRVAAAKEVWSAVASGELARLPGLVEPFSLVGDSVNLLYPEGGSLARALHAVATQIHASGDAPSAELAMEVATSLLYLEASLEDADFAHPDMPSRVRRLAKRLDDVRHGLDPGVLDLWMEELYRRVSDRQTMGNVVQELRSSLSEVEKQIDQYFRNPAAREVLIPVPGQLSSMRGVLSLLDLDQASQAVVRMRDDVDALASTEVVPEQAIQNGTFDRLADNLGALSFLIDMVSVQPQAARSLFRFDAATGMLKGTMARAARQTGFGGLEPQAAQPTLAEQVQTLAEAAARPQADPQAIERELERLSQQARAADETALAELASRAHSNLARATDAEDVEAARRELAESINEFVVTQELPLLEPLEPSRPVPPPTPPAAPGQTGLEDDAEMREIFLEEAREVFATARGGLHDLHQRADDLAAMTVVRRAFHTLKGSSRMVGLTDFGDAAWACEQLFNARLADPAHADADLRGFSNEVLDHFERWVDAIEANAAGNYRSEPVVQAADALRMEGRRLPLAAAPVAEGAAEMAAEGAAASAAEAAAELSDTTVFEPFAATTHQPYEFGAAATPVPPAWGEVVTGLAPAAPPSPATPTDTDLLSIRIPDLPSASDLDLDDAMLSARAQTADASTALPPLDLPPVAAEPELAAFELDLTPPAQADGSIPALADGLLELDLELDLNQLGPEAPEQPAPEAPPAGLETFELDLSGLPEFAGLAPAPVPEPSPEPASEQGLPAEAEAIEEEPVKVIGNLRVSIPLFNIFLGEADELSRHLCTELAEWRHELHRPAGETPVVLAHSLAGNSATVGYAELSQLARLLEHAVMRANQRDHGRESDAELFDESAEEIRRLLHQFAAGFLVSPNAELMRRLGEVAHEPAEAESPSGFDEAVVSDWAVLPATEAVLEPLAVEPAAEPQAEPVVAAEPEPVADLLPEPEPTLEQASEHTPEPAPEQAPEVEELFGQLGQPALMPFTASTEEAPTLSTGRVDLLDLDEDIDAVDAIDVELFPIFEEEASELIPLLQSRLRDWSQRPTDADAASACMRTLHTLKGGARLAGAMQLGEVAHRLESAIAQLHASGQADALAVDRLVSGADALEMRFEALRGGELASAAGEAPTPQDQAPVAPHAPVPSIAALADEQGVPATPQEPVPPPAVVAAPAVPAGIAPAMPRVAIDWSRFIGVEPVEPSQAPASAQASAALAAVRVRGPLLDRLVNHAGEVSITRARIEADVAQLKGSLGDLTDNLERLRSQLRDIELQAETQIGTRMEAARVASQQFDPLEMDRFTRFQELTRMMAESVNDVATVQRGLQRTVQSAEDDLAQQARLTRDLQDDLLRTRMVEFDGLSERLYRVVRQAAKETGKQVRLDIRGGNIEVDRGVLDRMTGTFEHLLRNSVVHGIEPPAQRAAAGKEPVGSIQISVAQEANEVAIEFRDDGAGLDLPRIQDKALASGLLPPGATPTDAELAAFIFQPGFTTAEQVTGLAGRGVGMDVVRNDVNAMGGRIETATAASQGTSFRLVLPLTTAVTQVVMLRCGDLRVAVPSTLVEIIRRVPAAELPGLYERGVYVDGGAELPFHWLAALLQGSPNGSAGTGRTVPLVVIRSAAQRIALHVDEVLGNQEVVVKNLGPQLSRLPGLTGLTLLPSGSPALIYNPVALATLHGQAARAATLSALAAARHLADQPTQVPAVTQAPLVLVVDDSLTVRRVTQRLLTREGYRVVVAKDGLEGLECLADELPALVLTDIEMPRMDGFDLVRNMRMDPRLTQLPVVMITSRIAQKHRDYAAELGVNHYLGKPYVEDDLLALVARYTGRVGVA
jgi:chemosensory pili system protein ChpA (sensor histidine kinase/response regulator)